MEIGIGKQYINKTWRFLAPTLKEYGSSFIKKFNGMHKLAMGIYDDTFEDTSVFDGRNLFILLDSYYQHKYTQDTLVGLRTQDFYVKDYPFTSNIKHSREHMLVLKVPDRYYHAYDMFLEGKYSKMYSFEECNAFYADLLQQEYINSDDHRKLLDYDILIKRSSQVDIIFKNKIYDEFNQEIDVYDLKNMEWELPLVNKEEVFNSTAKNIFFDKEINMNWKTDKEIKLL